MRTTYSKGILGLAQEMKMRHKTAKGTLSRGQTKSQTFSVYYDYMEPIDMRLHQGVYVSPYQQEQGTTFGFSSSLTTRPSPLADIMDAGLEYEVEPFEAPERAADNTAQGGEDINNHGEEQQAPDIKRNGHVQPPPTTAVPHKPPAAHSDADRGAPADPAPVGAEPGAGEQEMEQEPGEAALIDDDDDFANDLREILSGQKRYDKSTKKVVSRASSSPVSPTAARPQQESTESGTKNGGTNQNSHAVFEDLKSRFARANTIDLGEISLEKRFSAFDADLDREEEAAVQHISDEEALRDVSELQGRGRATVEYSPRPGSIGRLVTEAELQPGDLLLAVSDRVSTHASASLYTGAGGATPAFGGIVAGAHAVAVLRRSDLSPLEVSKLSAAEFSSHAADSRMLSIGAIAIHPSVCDTLAQGGGECRQYRGPIDFATDTPVTLALFPQAITMLFESINKPLGTQRLEQAHYIGHLKYPGH